MKLFAFDSLIRVKDRATAPIRRIGAAVDPLRLKFKGLNNRVRAFAVSAKLNQVPGRIRAVGSAFGSLVKRVAALGAAGLAGFVASIETFARSGDNVAKVSKRIGVGVETLQELRFAADRSGIDVKNLETALVRFQSTTGDAFAGIGVGKDAFRALGVEIRGADRKIRPMESILDDVADALSRVESPIQRNAIAARLFGQRGVALVQLLADGSKATRELRMEYRRLGGAITADAAKASEDFIDAQTDLKVAMLGVRNVIGSALLPDITRLARSVTEFVVSNRPRIAAWVEDFKSRIPGAVETARRFLADFRDTVSPIVGVVKALSDRFGAGRVAAVGLGAVLGGELAVALGGLIGPMVRIGSFALPLVLKGIVAVGGALLGNPIGLTVTAIALGAALIIKHWKPIKAFFADLWDGVKNRFTSFLDVIRSGGRIVKGLIPESVRNLFAPSESTATAPRPSLPSFASLTSNGQAGRTASVKTEPLNGKIAIEVRSDRPARVVEAKAPTRSVDLDVTMGPLGAGL